MQAHKHEIYGAAKIQLYEENTDPDYTKFFLFAKIACNDVCVSGRCPFAVCMTAKWSKYSELSFDPLRIGFRHLAENMNGVAHLLCVKMCSSLLLWSFSFVTKEMQGSLVHQCKSGSPSHPVQTSSKVQDRSTPMCTPLACPHCTRHRPACNHSPFSTCQAHTQTHTHSVRTSGLSITSHTPSHASTMKVKSCRAPVMGTLRVSGRALTACASGGSPRLSLCACAHARAPVVCVCTSVCLCKRSCACALSLLHESAGASWIRCAYGHQGQRTPCAPGAPHSALTRRHCAHGVRMGCAAAWSRRMEQLHRCMCILRQLRLSCAGAECPVSLDYSTYRVLPEV